MASVDEPALRALVDGSAALARGQDGRERDRHGTGARVGVMCAGSRIGLTKPPFACTLLDEPASAGLFLLACDLGRRFPSAYDLGRRTL